MKIDRKTARESKVGRSSKNWSRRYRSVLLVCVGYFSISIPCFAQENPRVEQSSAPTASQENPPKPAAQDQQSTAPANPEAQAKKKKKKLGGRGAFVVAPLPISSPAIGSGIVPVLGYIFPFSKTDKVSPPSTIGAAGLITDNGSRGFAIGGQFFLKQNTYEITTGFVHGNVDYNIYGTGIASNLKLPLEQTGEAFFGEFLRRIGWKFFVGPRFITGRSFITIVPNSNSSVPIPPEIGLHSNLTSLGARLTRDTRPNHFYPLSGTFFTFTSDFFSQGLGSKYSYQSYKTEFSKFWSLSPRQVLAYDADFCATSGAPPFYGNCIYGTNNQLRGYIAGKYFTRETASTQLEYRLVLPKRFGLVVFGGLGGTIPGGSQPLQQLQSGKFLPSGGGGLRFALSQKYHVNLRADIAQGRDGHTFGMGVGEAF
ncbi:MAG TPA: BamA/TamA family outer membrane protein [Candidatus Acidoferrum sp.]|nr:BamA/TamA family outer membrane protein [Candidatus Acidoferrum sp.]